MLGDEVYWFCVQLPDILLIKSDWFLYIYRVRAPYQSSNHFEVIVISAAFYISP